MQHLPTGTFSRLRDAFRIAFLLRVPETRLIPTWGEIVAAAFLALCVPTAFALFSLGSDGGWSLHRLPEAWTLFLVAVVAATALGWITGRSDAVPVLVFATLLAWIVIDLVTLAAWLLVMDGRSHWGTAFFVGPLAWLAVALARFAVTLAPISRPRRASVLIVTVAFLAAPMAYFQPERSLWVRQYVPGAEDLTMARGGPGSEQMIYAQPRLLARMLDSVQPGRPGVADVFFVGVAGYGGQDVFMREVDSVAHIMAERFDAEGRIVTLVNNPRTVLQAPIATLTALRATLQRVAERMDADEDVLVLFLTSHGTADHRFAMELEPLRLEEMQPAVLRKALDASGIRNRVIVVSACYSGGFIEALKSPDTLVISAAAPDRNSFGCSNEADWTYFGKAYFDEALRQTYSFAEAFALAAPAIEQREKSEKQIPSMPQMAVGENLRPRLAALEERLAGRRLAQYRQEGPR